jgi:hypothetical protein
MAAAIKLYILAFVKKNKHTHPILDVLGFVVNIYQLIRRHCKIHAYILKVLLDIIYVALYMVQLSTFMGKVLLVIDNAMKTFYKYP